MSNELKKISLDELPAEFALTNSEGDIVMLVFQGKDSGYLSVDFKGVRSPGARVFELGGVVQEHGPTISNRLDVEVPEVKEHDSYLNVDGHFK